MCVLPIVLLADNSLHCSATTIHTWPWSVFTARGWNPLAPHLKEQLLLKFGDIETIPGSKYPFPLAQRSLANGCHAVPTLQVVDILQHTTFRGSNTRKHFTGMAVVSPAISHTALLKIPLPLPNSLLCRLLYSPFQRRDTKRWPLSSSYSALLSTSDLAFFFLTRTLPLIFCFSNIVSPTVDVSASPVTLPPVPQ